MSLTSAVQKAKDAAAHAKPFMKLMDAFAELDGELRAAGQLQKDAEDAATKKAQVEADIPGLQKTCAGWTQTIVLLKSELAAKQAAFDKNLAELQKAADAVLAERHAKIELDHESKITAMKNQISTLGGTISTLEKQKSDVESQIGALRKTFEDAHAALHA